MVTHQLLFGAGVVLWIMFCVYINQDRRLKVSGTTAHSFSKVGVDPRRVTHDEDMWYYDGLATCVGYGISGEECAKFRNVCSGPGRSFAEASHSTQSDQASAVRRAVDNGGTHPGCPQLFVGAS